MNCAWTDVPSTFLIRSRRGTRSPWRDSDGRKIVPLWAGDRPRASSGSSRDATCTRTTFRLKSWRSTTNFRKAKCRYPAPPKDIPMFLGYPREDGRAGTRNYIAVVAASNCAAHTAELIAASFEARAAAQRGWRGGVSARRRLRPHHRPGYRTAPAHAGGRAGVIPMSRRRSFSASAAR